MRFIFRPFCKILGHKWKYLCTNEYGKVFECRRCGRVWASDTGVMR